MNDVTEIAGIDELLGGKPFAVNGLSMLPKSPEAMAVKSGKPVNPLDVSGAKSLIPAMAVKFETGCDSDPDLPIVAAFVRTGHAIDETLDIDALKAVWS